MARKKSDGMPVKTTLYGYERWAFEKFRDAHGKEVGPALRSIIERWAYADREFLAKELGVSLESFSRSHGGNVVQIPRKSASPKEKDSR
jgi:hypothetical protein